MGIAEWDGNSIIIKATLIFYGNAATEALAHAIAADVEQHWNEPGATVLMHGRNIAVHFLINGVYAPQLVPLDVIANTDPMLNFFRVEAYASGNISYVDGINSNTGYFKLDNLLNGSTTAAHEFGHTLGLHHPTVLDIRGKGVPGIMYPRGTIVDPPFQYDPAAEPLAPGGTMNPFFRKVLQQDVDDLKLNRLNFVDGRAILGAFSSVWHEAHKER